MDGFEDYVLDMKRTGLTIEIIGEGKAIVEQAAKLDYTGGGLWAALQRVEITSSNNFVLKNLFIDIEIYKYPADIDFEKEDVGLLESYAKPNWLVMNGCFGPASIRNFDNVKIADSFFFNTTTSVHLDALQRDRIEEEIAKRHNSAPAQKSSAEFIFTNNSFQDVESTLLRVGDSARSQIRSEPQRLEISDRNIKFR
eukprot:TRINITY_DN8134_c0_g1_i1.p1 TRINITY_DN8134_c0_g1~~TRINITY_DN8134_c0_g1_i1.p1  ORF type:complete len:197 (+),score=41.49 TRINITY_DN8134_c0_g1_i1:389-979(+)